MSWKEILTRLGGEADAHYDQLRQALRRRLGSEAGPLLLQPYRWHGTFDTLYVRGRVLADRGLRAATESDTVWDNLLNTYRRFETDEVPGARLRASYRDVDVELVADDEGYFAGAVPVPDGVDATDPWQQVQLTLLEPGAPEAVTAPAPVLVPPAGARFGVISDVDDTVLQTHATSYLKAAQVTFLQNARMRLPFPGVAAFYRALQAGPAGSGPNPIFYLSSSPWNLYDLLSDFMALQQIPAGPLLLRDVGFDEEKFISSSHHDHKLGQIERVFQTHPDLDFILIGDSGQKDPEIYAEVVEKYGDRVLGVYIRDVTQDARDEEVRHIAAGIPVEMHLVADSVTAARHAADQGWITGRSVDAVEAETHVDEADPDEVERLLGREDLA